MSDGWWEMGEEVRWKSIIWIVSILGIWLIQVAFVEFPQPYQEYQYFDYTSTFQQSGAVSLIQIKIPTQYSKTGQIPYLCFSLLLPQCWKIWKRHIALFGLLVHTFQSQGNYQYDDKPLILNPWIFSTCLNLCGFLYLLFLWLFHSLLFTRYSSLIKAVLRGRWLWSLMPQ